MSVRQSTSLSGSRAALRPCARASASLRSFSTRRSTRAAQLFFDGDLGGHLCFAHRAPFLFDRDFGIQFVFLDHPFLFDSSIAARVNCFVGIAKQFFPGVGLQRFGHLGRGLDRKDRQSQQFDAQHGNRFGVAESS